MFLSLAILLLAPQALSVPFEHGNADKPTIYMAWTRPQRPIDLEEPIRTVNKPLRQNGTWMDVGVWEHREDIISALPFLFTLAPSQNSSTFTLVAYTTDTLSPTANKKLAYSEGDVNLPVNYGATSAFILTDAGNTATQVIDAWTIEKDHYGRNLLGIG
ncbi:hypothetical protein BDV95DRAFT_606967 [Massariosphaeria phaeospora]|uniref:Uncharacterized protein n=1 Tax=Massariosphaeria phaeospora TaxID=100035 RepID=A0A7C8I9F9_9PLEO|nr:hypothetical protein BDV95DRAFT_606967 [Massariosphaeria phaeospora]